MFATFSWIAFPMSLGLLAMARRSPDRNGPEKRDPESLLTLLRKNDGIGLTNVRDLAALCVLAAKQRRPVSFIRPKRQANPANAADQSRSIQFPADKQTDPERYGK